jgi:diacylglycerol kinase family enzyme
LSLITFIVNPAASRIARLRAHLPAITAMLEHRGQTLRVLETTPDGHATAALTSDALQISSLIVACGGDGTVHTILQAMVGPKNPGRVPLGIIPIGTANALAANLGLPLDPLAAMARLLTYEPHNVVVGEAQTSTCRRFFLTMAGCGPDGALARMLVDASRTKALFGRSTYYAHAARLFFTRRWPAFEVRFRLVGSQQWQTTSAVALMAARVPDLGGLFAGLTPGVSLFDKHLHVHLLRAPAQLAFPAWFASARTGLPNPWLQLLDVEEVRCSALSLRNVDVQADAEPIGALPLSLRVVPDALDLLMPSESHARGIAPRSKP